MWFKQYLLESESDYQEEIKKTLNKLPKRHALLIKDFKFEFQGGNTLKGDNGHVGVIDSRRKKIIIAAPFFYGREHCLLHELGHLIYSQLTSEQKKNWIKIVKNTNMKKEDRQNPEELFCHGYASLYGKNPPSKFDYPEWNKFIKIL